MMLPTRDHNLIDDSLLIRYYRYRDHNLIDDLSDYEGLTILINSLLIKYLNKVTMTDNIHGRDLVIKNIKNIVLNNIKCENDIYIQLGITNDELELIKNTI